MSNAEIPIWSHDFNQRRSSDKWEEYALSINPNSRIETDTLILKSIYQTKIQWEK